MGKLTLEVKNHLVLPGRVASAASDEQIARTWHKPVVPAIPAQFIIDTGSKQTSLVPDVLERLKVRPIGTVRVETALSAAKTNLFGIRLEFADHSLVPIPRLTVARLAMPPSLIGFQGVIGRDVLSRWELFQYEGRRGRITIRDTPASWLRWFGL